MSPDYRTRRVDLGDVTFTLDEWPQGHGRIVLFLHATGFSRGVWRPMAEGLVDVCRPIALDLPGHGDSPTSSPAGGWIEMAGQVERLAEREGWTEFVVVGHSLGGGVGILLAEARPDLVSALALLEAPLRRSSGTSRGPTEMIEVALRRRFEWPSREEAAAHLRARSPYDSWRPDVFAGFVETGLRARDGTDEVELACARETEAAVFQGSPPGALWAALPQIECPVWIGRGTGSRGLGSTTASEAATLVPSAREWVAEGAGHFVPLERPEWVQAIVREIIEVLDAEVHGAK